MSNPALGECRFAAWRCTPALSPDQHEELRRELALNGFKWDSQVGDTTTLAPFAVVLPAEVGAALAQLAESLAAELTLAEQVLVTRPDLWARLGLPGPVRSRLSSREPWTPTAARVVRFDFHPTPDGWRISEANSDVPGGFIEATHFTRMMAEFAPLAQPAGDPLAALSSALAVHAKRHGRVALLAAPGYLEDQQIVACIGAALREHGLETRIARPDQLRWVGSHALLGREPIDVIYRFYQGEWMTRIADSDWLPLFRGGLTPVCNPASALFSESKRLPIVRPELGVSLPTWDALLPRTLPVSAIFRRRHHDAVLKPAYGNTGDDIVSRAWSSPAQVRAALAHALLRPQRWVAQSHFETLPIATPIGPLRACIGVYTVNGRACGIYGRLTAGPLIDFAAIDTAVLIAKT